MAAKCLRRARSFLLDSWKKRAFRQSVAASRTYYTYSPEPFHPLPDRKPLWGTAEEAVSVIKSGDRVFVHGTTGTPTPLLEAMALHGKNAQLSNVEVVHLFAVGPLTYTNPEYKDIFRDNAFFLGSNARQAANEGRADVIPIFLSEIPSLFRRKGLNLDVALVQVSPPDRHGYCTLGTSVECTRAAIQNAKYIIGLVNKQMPRTFGDGMVHLSHFDVMVDADWPLPDKSRPSPTEQEMTIGRLIAENLVPDGATIQAGLGSIPHVVMTYLHDHKDLGIHSEMFSDTTVDLVEDGIVTNAKKEVQTGKIVGTFVMGTKKVYDYVNNNPFVLMCDVSFVNNVSVIRQNPKIAAINECIEVDITGQVVSDSIGTRLYSGVGGQVDFMRGAALGDDGKGRPIIALTSRTHDGTPKVVPVIKEGAGVVCTRAHIHYVVTEYGIAYLFGKNYRQRAHALINIAHPDDRENLEKAAYERLQCMPSP